MVAAASPTAVRLPAQCRFTDWPGTCGKPAVTAIPGHVAAVKRFGEKDVVDVRCRETTPGR